ncbi:MAG: hypothetical protein EAZ08_01775 [Cytophagales bacterium]|nr:MAG: hypothetical protein EAZ08_01775 [Cytophagales bacterium]
MMNKYIIRCYITVFLFFTLCYAYAQELKFWHLTVREGLTNNAVNCFLQDSKGFMWIGTDDGLNRYDGYGFKTYRHEAKKKYSIENSYINALHEDQNKNIWIATNGGGLYKYDRKYDRFLRISEITQENIYAFLEDTKNQLWVAAGNLLFRKEIKSNEFIPYPQFTDKNLSSMIRIDENRLLIATNGAGFYILDTQTGRTQQFFHQENQNSLCNNQIVSVYKDINRHIWIGTEDGLDRFDIEKQVFEHLGVGKDSTRSLLAKSVRSINGRGNELFFATENGGLSVYHLKTANLTHYLPDESKPTSLSDVTVRSVYIDRQQRLWAGTFSGGVNINDPHQEKFSKPSIPLKNKTVNAILKDSKNRLWIGTEGGLTVEENGEIVYYTHDPKQANSLANNPVLSIFEDNRNRIWVATWAGGLSIFDEEKKQFTNFTVDPTKPDKLTSPNIIDIHQSTQTQQMLAVSVHGGLYVLTDEKEQKFENYKHNPEDNTSITYGCRVIYEDSKKNIWVGTINGLNRFDILAKKFTRYLHNKQDSNSISSNMIYSILEDSKGQLWIGTSQGLNKMINEKTFANYTTSDGLPSNSVNSISEDGHGNLWLGTNGGISKFNIQAETFRNYDEGDGLQSKQFKVNSNFKDKNGQLFLGGVKGFNTFHPDSVRDNTFLPNTIITDLKIFNKSVQIGDEDSLLKQDISQTKEIMLNYQQTVFSFDFVALNLTQSEKNKYAYMMEGFEKNWNYVGSQRTAIYTNLDAGTYTFKVKASNNDGIWNEESTSLKIIILPPWWETWWFRLIATSLFLSGGVLFYFVRVNAIKKQNRRLEEQVKQRTQQLESANYEIKSKNEALQTSEEELRQNMEELETNQALLKEQKQTIETAFLELNRQNTKVKDSIRYAQRIQNAILPHESILDSAFDENFIIFKPKDVVSGDFYWYLEIENKKFIAVVDCTGHGVPGAFMSMIGNTLLYEIINTKRIFEPNLILENLHSGILNSLNKKEAKMQDGMDIALCCLEMQESNKVKVLFSGAKRPLFYFSANQLTEVQADRKSIGHKTSASVNYTLNEIILQKGDTLYMTTDGWIDAINPERVRFGSQKFKDMLLGGTFLPLAAQGEMFGKILEEYEQGTEQRDDILLVGVRI